MSKIVSYIKGKLGINQLEEKILNLESENKSLKLINKTVLEKMEQVRSFNEMVSDDNSLIKSHLRLINSEFMVYSDINPSGYDPNVVLITKKGKQDIIKTYEFTNETVEEVYRILEGFGRENNRIDKPRSMRGPNFRY